MIVNSWGISPRVASVVAHVWYQSHTIISISQALVLPLCFKKLFCSEIKLAISAALESGQNTSGASSGASSWASSGASTGATQKVAVLVARATWMGASHSSGCWVFYSTLCSVSRVGSGVHFVNNCIIYI